MTSIKVSEVADKEMTLRKNIRTLLEEFKDETGMYVECVYLNYFDSISKKRSALDVELITRLNN